MPFAAGQRARGLAGTRIFLQNAEQLLLGVLGESASVTISFCAGCCLLCRHWDQLEQRSQNLHLEWCTRRTFGELHNGSLEALVRAGCMGIVHVEVNIVEPTSIFEFAFSGKARRSPDVVVRAQRQFFAMLGIGGAGWRRNGVAVVRRRRRQFVAAF